MQLLEEDVGLFEEEMTVREHVLQVAGALQCTHCLKLYQNDVLIQYILYVI